MIISSEPAIISTILGSCVSVVLYSKKAQVGGITHFALPDRSHASHSTRNDLNFGFTAITKMYEEILEVNGVRKNDLEAKIIGGGCVINEIRQSSNIGALNIQTAQMKLTHLNVPIVAQHVGGSFGRRLFFFTHTGRLRVAFLCGLAS